MLNEIEWLDKQLKLIDQEMSIVKNIGTDNAKQSLVIYNVWRSQLVVRKRELAALSTKRKEK